MFSEKSFLWDTLSVILYLQQGKTASFGNVVSFVCFSFCNTPYRSAASKTPALRQVFWFAYFCGRRYISPPAAQTVGMENTWLTYINEVEALLRVHENFDILVQPMEVGGRQARLYTIDGLTKDELLNKMMQFWLSATAEQMASITSAAQFRQKYFSYTETDLRTEPADMAKDLLSGASLLFVEPFREALIIDARTYPVRSVGEPEDERVLRGAHDGFVETLIFNTALLRRRIRDTRFTIEAFSVGRRSQTDVALAYLDGKADKKLVDSLRRRIRDLDINALTMGQESLAEALVHKGWYNPFPKVRYTERPDNAAAAIYEGRVVLLVDNSSSVMLLPVSLFDFIQENNDFCFPPVIGGYIRLVRMLVFMLTVYLTPVWYLLVHSPGRIPDWLQFMRIDEPVSVPLIVQLLLFELIVDGLRLASLNTPSSLSSSFSVIGALILGDFAVQAGWFAPEVILYMGFVTVGHFTQPSYELSYAHKLMRILMLVCIALLDVWGFVLSQVIMFLLIATNRTVSGGSYLYPLIPFRPRALAGVLLRRSITRHHRS